IGIDDRHYDGRGVVGQAVVERTPMIVQDVMSDSRIVRKHHVRERGLQSLVILPFQIADEVVGVLALHAAEAGFFDAEEMKLLSELAGDIGFALDHIEKAERLDYFALYDPLTGLPNRKLFSERLDQRLTAATRDKSQLAGRAARHRAVPHNQPNAGPPGMRRAVEAGRQSLCESGV